VWAEKNEGVIPSSSIASSWSSRALRMDDDQTRIVAGVRALRRAEGRDDIVDGGIAAEGHVEE